MSQLGREPELSGEQHTGTEGLEDDRSPKSAPATPELGSPATGRFVDARSSSSKWAWFVSLPDHAHGRNNRLAASDADCSNAAFFRLRPEAGQGKPWTTP